MGARPFLFALLSSFLFTSTASAQATTCPQPNLHSWLQWRWGLASEPGRFSTIHEYNQFTANCARADSRHQAVLSHSLWQLCSSRYERYLRFQTELGAQEAPEPPLDIPEIMELPAPFRNRSALAVFNQAQAVDRWREASEQIVRALPRGTRAFLFESDVPPPDRSGGRGRILFYIPGDRFDRYVQLVVDSTGTARETPTNISMITVQKQSVTGRPLRPVVTRFVDFFRPELGRDLPSDRPRTHRQSESCAECHGAGLPHVVQGPGTVSANIAPSSESIVANIAAVNQAMTSYGPAVVAGDDPEARGPVIGQVDPPFRTDAFLETCASQASPQDRARIRRAMNCASCHNGSTLSEIRNEESMFGSVVTRGRMPPGSHPTDFPRGLLGQCLEKEISLPAVRSTWLNGLLNPPECRPQTGRLREPAVLLGNPVTGERAR